MSDNNEGKDTTEQESPKKEKPKPKRRDHRRFRSEPPTTSALFGPRHQSGGDAGGLEEEAESHLLRVLEERKARAQAHDVDWKPSVEGERPPLRRVSFQAGSKIFTPEETEHDPNEDAHQLARNRFKMLAMKIHTMKSNRNLGMDSPGRPETVHEEHEPDGTDVDVFEGVGGTEAQVGISAFSQADTNTDNVIGAAIAVAENYRREDDDTLSVASDSVYSEVSDTGTDQEMLPLTGTSRPTQQQGGWFGFSAAARRKRRRWWRKRKKKLYRCLRRTCRRDRFWFGEVLHPVSLLKAIGRFLARSWFTRLGVPCLFAAFVLFYFLRNPSLDFMGKSTISWWFVFITRQSLTFQLAIISQSIVIDAFALKSRHAVKMFSPLLTLCVISSRGWPFIAACKFPSL